MKKCIILCACFFMFFSLIIHDANAGPDKNKMVVANGKVVSFDYTLTVDGEVVDTSEGRTPLQYTPGENQIIPGLASQLEGLKAGDSKLVTVAPGQAYGEVNPQAFREVPKSSLPPEVEPKAGMILQLQGPEGQTLPVKIAEVKEDAVVLDLNHPLAGKTLTFQVKIVSVKNKEASE